jgi:hypothetical protein
MSRNKGKSGEREIAALVCDLTGWDVRRRVRQHTDDSDLEGVPGWCVEVKRHARAGRSDLAAWWDQAAKQARKAGHWPVLFYRTDRDQWRAVWPLAVHLGQVAAHMELAAKHGSDASLIARRAKRLGWTRDLTSAVRQATRASVLAETVKQRVAEQAGAAAAQQVDAVLAGAELNKQVILRHRADIARTRDLVMSMLDELEHATRRPEALHALAQQAAEGMDPQGALRLQEAVRDAVKLSTRMGSLHKLSDTLAKLQTLERKAFSLDDDGEKSPNSYEDSLRELVGTVVAAA